MNNLILVGIVIGQFGGSWACVNDAQYILSHPSECTAFISPAPDPGSPIPAPTPESPATSPTGAINGNLDLLEAADGRLNDAQAELAACLVRFDLVSIERNKCLVNKSKLLKKCGRKCR